MIRILLTAILLIAAAVASAREVTEEADADIRANPVIEETPGDAAAVRVPAYIRRDLNHITMNGADWSALRAAMAAAHDTAVNIVHIGDSHLQADFATAEIRNRLQNHFGSHGRGLIIPFRMAGTNEPHDYYFRSPDGMVTSRLLRLPWSTDMAFTGVSVSPATPGPFRLTLKATQPFDSLTFFATAAGLRAESLADASGHSVDFKSAASSRTLSLSLPVSAAEVTVTLSGPRDIAVGGVSLSSGNKGVAYHVIGNNGATYSTYSLISGMGAGVRALGPRLIIISLGTNEAFGKTTSAAFRTAVDELVTDLRRHNPDAALLLVTPAECYRRTTRTVSAGRTRKGKRRRGRRVTTYAVNANVKRMRDVIAAYGAEHHIPVYDWYAVAGGAGAAAHWLADKNLGRDRIHLTAAGYRLQGQLTADALLRACQKTDDNSLRQK